MKDDPPIRDTLLLSDIYQRCNVTICEPVDYEKALNNPKWKKAMEEELCMIESNTLADIPPDRKVIAVK